MDTSLTVSQSPGFAVLVADGLLPGLFGGVVATGAGVAATISGVRSVSRWWRLATTESVSIPEALTTAGLVQIQGRVRPSRSGETLVSPVHDETCVVYECTIDSHLEGQGDPHIDAGIAYTSFVIADETAAIVVDPDEDAGSDGHGE